MTESYCIVWLCRACEQRLQDGMEALWPLLCVGAVVNGTAVSNLTVPISVQVQRFLQERLPGAGFLGGWDYVLTISFRGDQTHPLRLCGPRQPLHRTPHTLPASVLEDPAPLSAEAQLPGQPLCCACRS